MWNRVVRLSSLALAFASIVAIVLAALPSVSGAADPGKQLRRVKGTVGYQTAATAPLTPIFGKIDLPDDALAVTQADSVAELALPDSSIVTLGAGTRVQIGAFNTTAAGPGSTILVNSGTLRFDIKRPAGGRANYQFQTATSQIAVRGTIGLLSVINGITNVACVQCAADSVVVTTGTQTLTLATGQLITINAAGSAVTGTLTPEATSAFGSSGVGTGAGGAAAGAGAGAGLGIAAGAAAAVAAGVAIANSNATAKPTQSPVPTASPTAGPTASPTAVPTKSPSPSPSPTVTASSLPTASPTPTAAPTATPTSQGNVNVTGARRAPAAAGAPAAAPGAVTSPHPQFAPPEIPGRGAHR